MVENQIKDVLLDKIKKRIKEEQIYIRKANEIDNKHYKMKVDIETVLKISDKLKIRNISNDFEYFKENENEDIIIIHNGNPYITYIIAIESIINETNIKICVNEVMLGTNLIIVKIINEVLKEMRIKTKVEIERRFEIENVKGQDNKKIVVLGNRYEYSIILKHKFKNVQYIPNQSISMYVESEELEELKQSIMRYCFENFIEIEIYEADNIEEALKQIEADNQGEKVMILTKENVNLELIQELKQKKGIEISINKNILKNIEDEL